MGHISDSSTILYFGLAAGIYLKPEYAIFDSRIVTGAVIFGIITVSRIVYCLVLYPDYFTPLKHIYSPANRSWLRGNSPSFLLETPYPQLRELALNKPNQDIIRYYMVANLERLVVTGPKALGELLVTKVYDFEKPELVRQSLRRITGDGILLAEGEEHKIQRKNLLPAFAYRHIKNLYPVFWDKSTEMVKMIEKDLESRKANGDNDNTVQISNWATRATLDIIGVAGMDHDFDSLRDPDNTLNQAYRKVTSPPPPMMKFLFVVSMLFGNPTWIHSLPTKRNKDIKQSGELIRNVARQMIRQKKAKMEDPKAETGIDIISVALSSGTFDEENLVDQSMTFLGAGHETTASALQWAVYALCKNPNVQTRLRDEIRGNLPSLDDPNPISAAAVDSLPYLNAVCNEVLRFHPSVPVTIRRAARDTTLAGMHIPKDTLLTLSPQVTNRLEELWGPDANEFNPERFMGPGKANTGGAVNNYAFLTFLHGPRACIGQGFAKAELACLLAATVGRFHIELKFPDAKLEIREGATVSPKDGVLALLTPLEGW
ncbi:Cytochrome P450 [Penicillium expansum]|uniref:Cytochrome P450 n=1 Tax=Penicillium expansum TaxID=27334 RepID=A0A0A2JVI6_PENEN|nr:Cytochrome P450 [Penicillium expansum]KGO41082.1 Cytochrome P450 [Penicillium expansum]KGO58851.1 Cytochrome P450 [Penicillium expansum]KGO69460.1 Cytochrome P450 [Penicillium expansum]